MSMVPVLSFRKLVISILLISSLSGSPLRAGHENGGKFDRSYLIEFLVAHILVASSTNLPNVVQFIRELFSIPQFSQAESLLPSSTSENSLQNVLAALDDDELDIIQLNTLLPHANNVDANDSVSVTLDSVLNSSIEFQDGFAIAVSHQGNHQVIHLTLDDFIRLFLNAQQTVLHFPENILTRSDSFSLIQMILIEMMQKRHNISFDSFLDACRELYYRLSMISNFAALTSVTSYNDFDDHSFALGSQWVSTVVYFKDGKKWKEYSNIAFKPSNSKNSYQAICSCYSEKSDCQILDCSGTVITHMYGSLALTLGEEPFNELIQNNPNLMIISTMNARFRFPKPTGKGFSERVEHPILHFELVEEIEIKSLQDLIPGDVVYFVNHPSYEIIFDKGYFSGEYCVYLGLNEFGEQIFAGLGMKPQHFQGVISTLKKAYESDIHIEFPETGESEFDDNLGIVGDSFPSMDNAVFCMRSFRSGNKLSSSKKSKSSFEFKKNNKK